MEVVKLVNDRTSSFQRYSPIVLMAYLSNQVLVLKERAKMYISLLYLSKWISRYMPG